MARPYGGYGNERLKTRSVQTYEETEPFRIDEQTR